MSFQIERIEGEKMLVNSYLITSPEGVVIVDGMLTVSDARAVRRRLDELRRPVLGAVVTHAHPDHYAGLGEMLRGLRVPIVATPGVRAMIARDDATKDQIVGPMMGAEWPTERRFPDQEATPGTKVELGPLALSVRDLGPAESPADSLWELGPRDVFVGDLVYSGMHAYLADGFHEQWLAVLDRLDRELAPDVTLHAGHGAPAGKELIAAQRRYVTAFVEAVDRARTLSAPQRREAVLATMRRVLPTEDLLFLMDLSIEPVATQLGASR